MYWRSAPQKTTFEFYWPTKNWKLYFQVIKPFPAPSESWGLDRYSAYPETEVSYPIKIRVQLFFSGPRPLITLTFKADVFLFSFIMSVTAVRYLLYLISTSVVLVQDERIKITRWQIHRCLFVWIALCRLPFFTCVLAFPCTALTSPFGTDFLCNPH